MNNIVRVETNLSDSDLLKIKAVLKEVVGEELDRREKQVQASDKKLTREEVAQKLKVCTATVDSMIKKGLKSERFGKRVLISQQAINDYTGCGHK